jgi:uncharacterized protein (TIGR03435 family)
MCVLAQPAFEVAEVKHSASKVTQPAQITPSGHIRLTGVSLKLLMSAAWEVEEYAILRGPAWLDSDLFDVAANAPPKTPPKDLRAMLKALLIERFQIAVHAEEKPMRVYALMADKGGPRLKETSASPAEPSGCTGQREQGLAYRTCRNTSMTLLAETLPRMSPNYVDAPVIDLTGLTGRYDFKIFWQPQQLRQKEGDAPTGPTIFDALRSQLGFRLESRKMPIPVVVIDKVERLP